MPRLPIVSGKKVVRALVSVGYEITRRRSSHIRLSHANKKSVTVPDYKVIGRGLLRKILREAEISTSEFRKLIKSD